MQGTSLNLEELAAAGANVFPSFNDQEQRIAIATYRALASGRPVSAEQIASAVGMRAEEVRDALLAWQSRVHFDRDGRVVAFMGLDLSPTGHQFELNGRTLYTWCAWDTLFIPRLVKQTARVQSACPITGRPIRLVSAPDAVLSLEPSGTVVSFLTPERAQVEKDIIHSFCCHVNFLSSADAAREWLSQHPNTLVLSVEEAWKVGQMCVEARFPIA